MAENIASLKKILLVHYNCDPNDEENSHKLKIRTASSINRNINLHHETKTENNQMAIKFIASN